MDGNKRPLQLINGGFNKSMQVLTDAKKQYEFGEHDETIETVKLYIFSILNRHNDELFVGLTPFINVKETMDALMDSGDVNILEYKQQYDILLSFYENRFFDEYTITYDRSFTVAEIDKAKQYILELNDKHLNKK